MTEGRIFEKVCTLFDLIFSIKNIRGKKNGTPPSNIYLITKNYTKFDKLLKFIFKKMKIRMKCLQGLFIHQNIILNHH